MPAGTRRDRVSAYIALTKPRIIELLLVTTLPAMVLAWSTVRGMEPLEFAWLAVWTLVGGTLAAGAANAINCYLDRDIDEIMVRTRRRPLPAHQVAPVDALMFGFVLTIVSFALLAVTTNLVAAFLTLLAIGFYVVVYTMLLKRSTPQNIVLGGAAGALPPVIGWAAVTGDITLPALLLFAIVFYWTPPHFWALSLRIRGDYAAANVPMLPVTHGVAETTRQIALYSVLMVALTLVFFAVAHMGLVFLAGTLVLGALFLTQAFLMWRDGTDARAVRLYKLLDHLPHRAVPAHRAGRCGVRAPGVSRLRTLVAAVALMAGVMSVAACEPALDQETGLVTDIQQSSLTSVEGFALLTSDGRTVDFSTLTHPLRPDVRGPAPGRAHGACAAHHRHLQGRRRPQRGRQDRRRRTTLSRRLAAPRVDRRGACARSATGFPGPVRMSRRAGGSTADSPGRDSLRRTHVGPAEQELERERRSAAPSMRPVSARERAVGIA